MKTLIRCLLKPAWVSRWIRWFGASPQPRLLGVVALAAVALGGVANSPSAGPDLLPRVGSWPGFTRGPAADVALADHYAYVAMGEGGLAVLDVADPAKPVRVGGFLPAGLTDRVQVVGSRAYLATRVHRGGGCETEGWRGALVILDVSDPTHPTALGAYFTGSMIQGFYVDGVRVYLGDDIGAGMSGHLRSFRIVDVSNPARPVALSMDHTRTAYAVWADGERAYVSSRSEVEVWDLSRPASPTVVTNLPYEFKESIRGIHAAGQYVYVARGESAESGEWGASDSGLLCIYDVSNPSAPWLKGSLVFNQAALDIKIAGNYAFLAMAGAGLFALDVSDPGKPVRVGTCPTPGMALRVEVAGGHAFVADYHGGLQVIDIRDPGHMKTVASFDTGLTTRRLRLAGDKAYLLGADKNPVFWNGLEARSRVEVLGLSDPARPVLLGTYDSARLVDSLDAAGGLVYLGWGHGGDSGLKILDFREPGQPVELSDTTNGPPTAEICGVRVDGHFAYITTRDGSLRILDVTDPIKPVRLNPTTRIAMSGGAAWVAGSRVYLNSDAQLGILDVANPQTPVVVGSGQCGSGYAGLWVAEAYAYLGLGWSGFRIVDARQPAKPMAVGEYNTVGEVNDLCVENHYAYIAEGWQGLEVFDVSQPALPVPIGGATTRGQARGVQVAGNYACVAEGGSGLAILSLPPGPVTVVEDPTSHEAALGDTATLTVRAYGRGSLSYQWYRGASGDVSHPVASTNGASLTTPVLTEASAYWVRVSNGTASGDSRTAWIHPVAPVALELISLWPGWRREPATNGFSEDVAVSGQLAFLADAGGGLKILNISDVTRPSLVGAYPANARRVAAAGQLVYLAADTLQVLDVSNPAQPNRIADLAEWADDIFLSGDYAYLSGQALRTVDVRDPATPKVVGAVQLWDYGKTPRGMAFMGPYACLGQEWDGMQVLDLGLPNQPRQVGSYYSDAPVWDVAVRGDVACVTLGSELPALEVLDLRDLQRPTRTARVPLPLANNVAFMGSYACVTGEGLQVFDLGDPYRPIRVGSHQLGSPTHGLQVVENLVYVAAGDYGLAIYRLTPQLRLNPPVLDSHGLSLSWLGAPGIRLQQSTSLWDPDWRDVPQSAGTNRLQLSATQRAAFFRLARAVHAAPEVVEWGAYWWDTVPSRLRTVPSSLSNVVAIAAGGLYNLALTTEGRLVAWGNYYDGTAYVPITVPSGLSNVVAIAAGYFHSVALLQQPTVPMPKLELSRGTSGLLLHTRGTPGISCQLLRASQLPGPWLPTEPVTFTNRMQWLRPPDASPSAQFFRLLRK